MDNLLKQSMNQNIAASLEGNPEDCLYFCRTYGVHWLQTQKLNELVFTHQAID